MNVHAAPADVDTVQARPSSAQTPPLSTRKHPAPKANFFLVGAPKAGTTSIDRLLRGHPDVFLPSIKEPCHFCPDVAEQLAPSFRKKQRIDVGAYLASADRQEIGLAWVTEPSDYARLFEGADDRKAVGECSTFYLSSAAAPGRIHAYNPDARIVAVLRRPLDRIRSHYEMDRAHGVAGRSLLSLVEEELALGEDANWGNCAYYVGASRYAQQLHAYYRYFAPDKVCVLSFEKLLADPGTELARLFAFLDIAAPAGPLALPSANRARAARFPGFNRALHASGLKTLVTAALKKSLPKGVERAAKSAYYRRGAKIVPDHELARIDRLLRDAGLDSDPGSADGGTGASTDH